MVERDYREVIRAACRSGGEFHLAESKYPKPAAVAPLANLTMRVIQVGFLKNPYLKLEESPRALYLRLDAAVLRQIAAEVQPMPAAPETYGIR